MSIQSIELFLPPVALLASATRSHRGQVAGTSTMQIHFNAEHRYFSFTPHVH